MVRPARFERAAYGFEVLKQFFLNIFYVNFNLFFAYISARYNILLTFISDIDRIALGYF